jgi:hypothetical protein
MPWNETQKSWGILKTNFKYNLNNLKKDINSKIMCMKVKANKMFNILSKNKNNALIKTGKLIHGPNSSIK